MATLVALPVLFFGRGSSIDIDASIAANAAGLQTSIIGEAAAPAGDSDATASSLLETIDGTSLLDGGADPTAALQLQRQGDSSSSTSVVVRPQSTNRPTIGSSPLSVVEQAASSSESAAGNAGIASSEFGPSVATPTDATPTTAAPTTAAPTTAAPTTAAPVTAAPTTAAPVTAAPTAAAPADEPAETGDAESTAAAPDNDPADAPSGVPSADDWATLRACESFGSYTIVSGNGLYHGAYQFSVATWNATAAHAGRPDLIDVLPSEASPADQDALALDLWSRRGFAPWPHCGRGLG